MSEEKIPFLFEVLKDIQNARTRAAKRKVLEDNNYRFVRDFLKGSFDDAIVFNLPRGEPPHEECEKDKAVSPDYHTQVLGNFVRGSKGDQIKPPQREMMFIDFLQKLHPEDVKYYIMMKDKKMEGAIKGLTKKMVSDVWPNLIQE